MTGWHKLSLEKATQMIYRKAGQVTWQPERAMELSCARFNAANVPWRDGQLIA